MPAARRQRSRLSRLLGGPLVILAVAAVIAYFVWQREKQQTAIVHDFVHSMCRQTSLGESLVWSLSQTDPLIAREVTERLQSLFAAGAIDAGDWWVDVIVGDDPELGDGTATHTARIVIMEKPMMGLRLRYSAEAPSADPNLPATDEIAVVGYWMEGP